MLYSSHISIFQAFVKHLSCDGHCAQKYTFGFSLSVPPVGLGGLLLVSLNTRGNLGSKGWQFAQGQVAICVLTMKQNLLPFPLISSTQDKYPLIKELRELK
jgi:ABC-type molybdate transport system permease subunit